MRACCCSGTTGRTYLAGASFYRVVMPAIKKLTAIIEDQGAAALAEVDALLKSNADPNQRDVEAGQSQTPLMAAARGGHADVCALLLAAHADHRLVDGRDRTALHLSAEAGHLAVTKLLLQYSANPCARAALPGYPSAPCCARWAWAGRSWCCGPTPLQLVRDGDQEHKRMLRHAAASHLLRCNRCDCQCNRLLALGARALAQRHMLRPVGSAGSRLETCECITGCSSMELFCAMAFCCLDEHFGLRADEAAGPPLINGRTTTPRWIRRIDDDPLVELYAAEDVELDVESPSESEEDEGAMQSLVARLRGRPSSTSSTNRAEAGLNPARSGRPGAIVPC